MKLRRSCVLLLTALAATACGGNQGTEPNDMSAEEHRRAGSEDDQAADGHDERYDPDARGTGGTGPQMANADLDYGLDVYNPTAGHHDRAERLRELAAAHRAAASALDQYEEAECGRFPTETRSTCPLLGNIAELTDVEGGVRIELVEGVRADAAADHMRCHLAFANTHGREGMPNCPLYVEGAAVGSSEGLTLTTGAGDEAVTELRRRARAHASE